MCIVETTITERRRWRFVFVIEILFYYFVSFYLSVFYSVLLTSFLLLLLWYLCWIWRKNQRARRHDTEHKSIDRIKCVFVRYKRQDNMRFYYFQVITVGWPADWQQTQHSAQINRKERGKIYIHIEVSAFVFVILVLLSFTRERWIIHNKRYNNRKVCVQNKIWKVITFWTIVPCFYMFRHMVCAMCYVYMLLLMIFCSFLCNSCWF